MKAKIDRGDNFVLIDVREPHEYQICNSRCEADPAGRTAEAGERAEYGRRNRGALQERRSAKAVDLKQAGFKKVRNMKGGILAWSDKVDPSVPKY